MSSLRVIFEADHGTTYILDGKSQTVTVLSIDFQCIVPLFEFLCMANTVVLSRENGEVQ